MKGRAAWNTVRLPDPPSAPLSGNATTWFGPAKVYKRLHFKAGGRPLGALELPPAPRAERHKMAAASLCLNLTPPLSLAPPRSC